MPSQLPSSFASAAAGQSRDSRSSGRDDSARGVGNGDWPRMNGSRTFRRPSTTPAHQALAANSPETTQTRAVEPFPAVADFSLNNYESRTRRTMRYSRNELLDIYKSCAHMDVKHLLTKDWPREYTNGQSSRPWTKGNDSHMPQDPSVCWDPTGSVKLIGLEAMSSEEREMFSSDVNTKVKPPQQGRDGSNPAGGQNGLGRKMSTSSGPNHTFNMPTTSVGSRPGTRRHETTDTNPFSGGGLATPTEIRFSSDDPWFARKSNDVKEAVHEPQEEEASPRERPSRGPPFGLPRLDTTSSSGLGPASSFWGGPTNTVTNTTTNTAANTAANTAITPGIGAFGSFALPTSAIGADKRFGAGRGESRLAHLMPKDSGESSSPKPSDDASKRSWRPRQRTETDAIGSGEGISGSAILGGAQDSTPPSAAPQPYRSGLFETPVKGNSADFGMSGLTLAALSDVNGPISPSDTNPYRSPHGEGGYDGHEGGMEKTSHTSGTEPALGFGTNTRAITGNTMEGSDRSQSSSVGANRFPTLGTSNPMGGWLGAPAAGTPDRDRSFGFGSVFGNGIFSPGGDLHSPGFGLGSGVFGPPAGGLSRPNSLRPLLPTGMASHAQGADQDPVGDPMLDGRQSNLLNATGRGPAGSYGHDSDSPLRSARGAFEDLFPATDTARSSFAGDQVQGLPATSQPSAFSTTTAPGFPASLAPIDTCAGARTMVMPDRMRWVYMDPQGTVQGPFSGLEMNDWYKAQFFTPDLRVRKLEDQEFEPLGQLIRRIGNSREPFLVPLMGVPHGPPTPAGPFLGDTRGNIPPLSNAFPTFGRTLTAEEQNNLERRKQEEQLFHARQREMAHHHQAFNRLQMPSALSGALHHQTSGHSLQSQPSFGSISSPTVMPPQTPVGPIGSTSAAFYEGPPPPTQPPKQSSLTAVPLDLFSPDLYPGEREMLASITTALPSNDFSNQLSNPIGSSAPAEAGIRSQLPGWDQLSDDSQGFNVRGKEFLELRAKREAAGKETSLSLDAEQPARYQQPGAIGPPKAGWETAASSQQPESQLASDMSLTQRVQKTQTETAVALAAAAVSVSRTAQQQSASSSGLPMLFPPPVRTSTPIVAPTAQRNKSSLPAQYRQDSESGTSGTSTSEIATVAPPPTAPWASQSGGDGHKGPNLKEIQEAEAKKAARREEQVAALRRAQVEAEAAVMREREKVVGLPTHSTWGTGSPVNLPSTGSPWKQPAGNVATSIAAGSTPTKKTLADIQREEEAQREAEVRRKRLVAQATVQAPVSTTSTVGTRYADLVSIASAPPGFGLAAPGWSTIGAHGRVIAPVTQNRTANAICTVKAPIAPAAKLLAKPVALQNSKLAAATAFKDWLTEELSRGLIGVTDDTLLELPAEPELLRDSMYAYSTTMDVNGFLEEFMRRKKLADKGVVEKQSTTSSSAGGKSGNGGWNEVARKGGSSNSKQEESVAVNSQIRFVQPGRKKAKK